LLLSESLFHFIGLEEQHLRIFAADLVEDPPEGRLPRDADEATVSASTYTN